MAVHGILEVLRSFTDDDEPSSEIYLLIEKRGPGCPDEIGKWANPTGYLDWDETLKEALAREVWEEIGLDFGKLEYCSVFEYGREDNPIGRQNVTIMFRVLLDYDEIKTLLKNGIINTDTVSRGGEKGEVSGIQLLKIRPRDSEVDPGLFAFNHGEIINELIRYYNHL